MIFLPNFTAKNAIESQKVDLCDVVSGLLKLNITMYLDYPDAKITTTLKLNVSIAFLVV